MLKKILKSIGVQIAVLPIIEVFAAMLGFCVIIFFIMFQVPFNFFFHYIEHSTQTRGAGIDFLAAMLLIYGNIFELNFSISMLPFRFTLSRMWLFFSGSGLYQYTQHMLLFTYLYFQFIEFIMTILFKQNFRMWADKELIVDAEGFDLTKRQLFIRAFTKWNYIFFAPFFMYKNKKFNIWIDDETQELIWDIKAETRVLTIEEYNYAMSEKQRIENEKLDATIAKKKDDLEKMFEPFVAAVPTPEEGEIENSLAQAKDEYFEVRRTVNVATNELTEKDFEEIQLIRKQLEDEQKKTILSNEQLANQYQNYIKNTSPPKEEEINNIEYETNNNLNSDNLSKQYGNWLNNQQPKTNEIDQEQLNTKQQSYLKEIAKTNNLVLKDQYQQQYKNFIDKNDNSENNNQ